MRHTFKNTVEPIYRIDKSTFIEIFYFKSKMSDIEIAEDIERRTHYKFSRTAIKRWRDAYGMKARTPSARYQLAMKKLRVDQES
jgi:hypothetical protein